MRALAVTAVVVFHLGATWLAGGFLGVDVFFTLSGFLITSILLTEFYARGRIDIKNFYLRRARRLLPALFTMLAAVTLLTWLFARDEMYRLRGDVIAALTYCTNWTQIVWNRGYFDQLGRPSLMQHLWSLAVEEQFYVLWPLILVAGLAMRALGRAGDPGRAHRRVAAAHGRAVPRRAGTGARLLRHRHAHLADADRRGSGDRRRRCAAKPASTGTRGGRLPPTSPRSSGCSGSPGPR